MLALSLNWKTRWARSLIPGALSEPKERYATEVAVEGFRKAHFERHFENDKDFLTEPVSVISHRDLYVGKPYFLGRHILGVRCLLYYPDQFPKPSLRRWAEENSSKETISLDGERCYVPLVHPGEGIYGHWLVDLLPIVWAVKSIPGFDGCFVLPESAPSYASALLSFFVSDDEVARAPLGSAVIRLPRAVTVTPFRKNQRINPALGRFASELVDRFGNNGCETPRRLFISREGIKAGTEQRQLINRAQVREYMLSEGYTEFCPEAHSFPEQIAYFNNADIVVGEDGSALHNSIFMRPGTRVIVLRGQYNGHKLQGQLCAMQGQNIGYVYGRSTENEKHLKRDYPYEIEIADLSRMLSHLAKYE